MTPKVSVIMPCYNEPEEIFRRSLESVLCQTLQDIEIILVLDKPDNQELKDIIGEYITRYEHIILLTPEKNLGRGFARNLAIQHASGAYIAIHDADDIDVPERLEEQYKYMQEHSEFGVVFSQVVHVDSYGNPTQNIPHLCATQENHPSFFKKRVNHATMFARKESFGEVRYKDLQFGEDLDVWIQFFRKGIEFGYTQTVHTHYLSPSFSTHMDYEEKMKGWKIGALKVLASHFSAFYRDPRWYGKTGVALMDLCMLQFGKENYLHYRKILTDFVHKK